MANLNALIQQPQSPQQPEQQGSSGTGDMSSMQALLQGQQPQGPQQGGIPQQQGMGPPAPNHAQTVAALRQISAYDKRWRQVLSSPGIGTKNVRGSIYEVMADMMGIGYASLPQVMKLLKTVPTDPLEQKQWLEKHVQQDEQAMQMVLEHHAAAFPGVGDAETEQANAAGSDDHASLVSSLTDHYQARAAPKPIGQPRGMRAIPMRPSNA